MATIPMLLTETNVRQFVLNWFHELDIHAPVEKLLPALATEGLTVRLPETTLYSHADFIDWYERVTHTFFDEVHEMKSLQINISSEQADVLLVVNWQAHIWNAPAPNSQWLGFDATQRWIVKASPDASQLIVTTYIVEELAPMPGSPNL